MKIRPRKRSKGFWDFEELSEIDEVFNVAMQSGIRRHPPTAHKKSISMNHLNTTARLAKKLEIHSHRRQKKDKGGDKE